MLTPAQRTYGSKLRPENLGTVQIKGMNVVRAVGSKWADMWNTWNWDSWIRPQIDVGLNNGANCIKVTASGISPEDGYSYPSDSVLRQRIETFCGYVAARGAVVYWNLLAHPFYAFGSGGTSLAANTAALQRVSSWLEALPNVVAIDVANEINHSNPTTWSGPDYARVHDDMAALFALVRQATSLPLTCSVLCQSVAEITGPWMEAVAPLVDFHDFHPYYTGATPDVADPTALRAASWYRGRYLIGEIGTSLAQTAPVQTTWTTNLGQMGVAPGGFGTVLFCAADYDTTAPFQFGATDVNVQNPRSQILTPFSAWPGRL